MSLILDNVSVEYGRRMVMQNVTLEAQRGRVLALVGPNGSGKSSLIKAVAGLNPYAGRIAFAGCSGRPKALGYMPQDQQGPLALSVVEVVLLGRLERLHMRVSAQDLDAVRSVLRRLGIEHLAARDLGELSGGQRQLVYLAQALVSEPELLLLDEPLTALDINHQLEVLELVAAMTRERQLCTVMVLHDLLATAHYADDVALLCGNTVLACGTPEAVLTPDAMRRVFGVEMEVLTTASGRRVLIPVALA
nr:ABC transporter ATP-binding protein [uncultured Rhodoferax sp.]